MGQESLGLVADDSAGKRYRAQFVIEGVGLLSSTNIPKFKGSETFKGEISRAVPLAPAVPFNLRGKRVAVIGTGSTGVQVITAIASEVGHLYVLQRTPQYVVPLGNQHPLPEAAIRRLQEQSGKFAAGISIPGPSSGFQESTYRP